MMKYTLFSILLIFIVNCSSDTVLVENSFSPEGEWLLAEVGYSPGDEYIVKLVPSNPPQLLVFNTDKTMSSSITELQKFQYYEIVDGKVLAFFETKLAAPIEIDSLKHSYSVALEGNSMKLSYRFCIEGCHLGFIRYRNDAN